MRSTAFGSQPGKLTEQQSRAHANTGGEAELAARRAGLAVIHVAYVKQARIQGHGAPYCYGTPDSTIAFSRLHTGSRLDYRAVRPARGGAEGAAEAAGAAEVRSDRTPLPEVRSAREIFDAAGVLAGAQREGELAVDAERLVAELEGVRAGGQRQAEERRFAARDAVDADVGPRRGVDVEERGRVGGARRRRAGRGGARPASPSGAA